MTAYFRFSRTLPNITMNQCAAVKKKGELDACRSKALRGHTLCGRHARMKSPTLWADANRGTPVARIQALVRGWLVRTRLSYAGFGVLRRKDLANDEDIITCTEKDRVYPMNFFSFEENGKFWWFEFDSLWTWCMRNQIPSNPYTKVPLTSDARKRLRAIWGYKKRHRETLPPESLDGEERIRHRVHILIQHFDDYGFSNIHPGFLLRCSRQDLNSVFVLLQRDIETVISEKDPFRTRVLSLCGNRAMTEPQQPVIYFLNCLTTLMYIVTLYRDPYVVTFSILSAFYRV